MRNVIFGLEWNISACLLNLIALNELLVLSSDLELAYVICWLCESKWKDVRGVIESLWHSFGRKDTLRCLALALKRMPTGQQTLSLEDEANLTFIGLMKKGVILVVCASDKGKVVLKDSNEGEDQHSSEGPSTENGGSAGATTSKKHPKRYLQTMGSGVSNTCQDLNRGMNLRHVLRRRSEMMNQRFIGSWEVLGLGNPRVEKFKG
eukprot:Gb_26044 [translate_table: standard]